jgi:hypothetical protein
MKTITFIITGLLFIGNLNAQQKIDKHISFSGKESLELKIQIADSINIHTWNKNEVYITASIDINDNKDNEAYMTSFDESGKSVVIKANFRDNYFKGKKNCCNKEDIYWQVYIPEKIDFSIETINANVTINGQTDKMKIKSISGFIDLEVPVTKKADIDFSTISGTIYSNLDLNPGYKSSGIPSVIKDKLNNGGPLIKLETISGDIFFRKSN